MSLALALGAKSLALALALKALALEAKSFALALALRVVALTPSLIRINKSVDWTEKWQVKLDADKCKVISIITLISVASETVVYHNIM